MSLKIDLRLKNGFWLINGKNYIDCSLEEKNFFDEFIKNVNLESAKNEKIHR